MHIFSRTVDLIISALILAVIILVGMNWLSPLTSDEPYDGPHNGDRNDR